MIKMKFLKEQALPITLTIITFVVLVFFFFSLVKLLNLSPLKEKIVPQFLIGDILVGLTIYLKTSVDFAIFIGNLMANNRGWTKRVAIETGTAIGNGLGTVFILLVWSFFKEVPFLMIAMIFLASLVLLRMAQDGLEEIQKLNSMLTVLNFVNKPFDRLISIILPHPKAQKSESKSWLKLLLFSITIPFVLGLDDFAGYIPLFSILNVVSFATGVFLGHMLLNISLFASPKATIRAVKLPIVILFGSLAFIGIGLFGFYEITRIISSLF